MAAPDSTALQANFKTPAGTLINVYGATQEQFVADLDFVKAVAPTLVEVESLLLGLSTVGQAFPGATAGAPPAAPPPAAPPQAPYVAPQPQYQQPPPAAAPASWPSSVPVGPDGRPRVAKSGVGAKGPWKGWFTAARKGEPGYADPIWVKQGTPEWDVFPS